MFLTCSSADFASHDKHFHTILHHIAGTFLHSHFILHYITGILTTYSTTPQAYSTNFTSYHSHIDIILHHTTSITRPYNIINQAYSHHTTSLKKHPECSFSALFRPISVSCIVISSIKHSSCSMHVLF